jgi:hypothetical protein
MFILIRSIVRYFQRRKEEKQSGAQNPQEPQSPQGY